MGPDDVGTPSPDAAVGDAADALESEGVDALVVTENEEPVGMVTDCDVARSVTDTDDIASEPVETVMTDDPVTIQGDEEAMEISRTIDDHDLRRTPVVDDGTLTGIVTRDDLVATIGEPLATVSDVEA